MKSAIKNGISNETCFWQANHYRSELISDSFRHLGQKTNNGTEKLFHFKESAKLLRRYVLGLKPGRHLEKYEAVWKMFGSQTPEVIVEIGSFDGRDSLEMSRMFPAADIFAFEADKGNYQNVIRNICVRGKIQAICKAVHDHSGTVHFYQSRNTEKVNSMRGSGSCLEPGEKLSQAWPSLSFDEPVDIPCVSLADWTNENGIRKIDFIWMDAQGAELHILKAAGKILQTVRAVLLEVWQESYYKGTGCFDEIKQYLESQGFELGQSWLDGDSGDALFIKRTKFDFGGEF